NANEDIVTDGSTSCAHKKKTTAPVTATLSTDAEDGSFMPTHALKKWLPDGSAAEEDAPPLSQPVPPLSQPAPPLSQPVPPLPQPAPLSQSPEDNREDRKTPLPPSTQPHRALPLPSQSPCTPSLPIVHDPGFTPSPSDFETTSAQERLHISRLHPTKCPVSQEELGKEDDVVFGKEIETKAKAKAKKGKGKARDNNGPFKLGPIPNEVKGHLYAIHANFERQVEELAAEIGKSLHLLFSLLGETPLPTHCAITPWGTYQVWYGIHREREKPNNMPKEEWAGIVSFEYNKYCDENLGPLSKDPDTCAELLKPELEWYAAKYGMYAEEKKTDGTFNTVITKVQQDFVHLAKLNHKYNGLHCFGFIVNLQPDHTNRTYSRLTLHRVAQLQLNTKDDKDTESKEEVEKQLWSVLDPGSLLKPDNNNKTFLAWLGNDIEHYVNTLNVG
ncbi:hypothetical protein DXG01_008905, partial [Tephrocybe rancida]